MERPHTATLRRATKQQPRAPLGGSWRPFFHVRGQQLTSPTGSAWFRWTLPLHSSVTTKTSSQWPPSALRDDEQPASLSSLPPSSTATDPNNGAAAAVSPAQPSPNEPPGPLAPLQHPDEPHSGETATAAQHSALAPAAGLPNPAGSPNRTGGSDRTGPCDSDSVSAPVKNLLETVWDLGTFALPLATQNVLGYSLNALSEGLVGRLGPTTLSASTLANSTYSLLGLSLAWGGAAGMETLCGQAHGAGKGRLMRLVLVRAVMVCWGVCVPLVCLMSSAEPLLLALGQSPALVGQSAAYLRALCPALFFYVLSECMQTYLVVQGHVRVTTGAKVAVTLLGPLYYWVCMFRLDLGLVGAGYAYALCKGTNAALLLALMALPAGGGGAGGAASSGSLEGSTQSDGNDVRASSMCDSSGNSSNSSGSNPSSRPNSSGGDPDDAVTRSAHRGVLTPRPSAAAAAAHEFSFRPLLEPTITSEEEGFSSSTTSGGGGGSCSEAAAAASRPVDARAGAAAAVSVVVGGQRALVTGLNSGRAARGLYARARVAATVLQREAAEVLDPRACWEYVKFGLPAAVMSCLEWWAYEALVIMAGWLPNADLALGCLGICLTVGGWVYMVPQAVATAVCSRIANALGAGEPEVAKRTFQAAYCLALLTQLTISAALLTNAASVAAFFCPDPTVAALTATLLPITAVNTIGDGLNCVLNGVLRACGRQSLGARVHLAAYWACGLPLAYLAAFKAGMGVRGVVVAIGATSFVQSLVVGGLISHLDWGREVRRSRALLTAMAAAA